MPLLARHSNGSHDISIFMFVRLRCSFVLSSSSAIFTISLDCLNKKAAEREIQNMALLQSKKNN